MSIVLKNGQQVIFLFDCEYIYELPNLLFGYIIKFDKSKIEIDTIKSITPTSNDTYKFITHTKKTIIYKIYKNQLESNIKIYLGKKHKNILNDLLSHFLRHLFVKKPELCTIPPDNQPNNGKKKINGGGDVSANNITLYSYKKSDKGCYYDLSYKIENNQLYISGRFYYNTEFKYKYDKEKKYTYNYDINDKTKRLSVYLPLFVKLEVSTVNNLQQLQNVQRARNPRSQNAQSVKRVENPLYNLEDPYNGIVTDFYAI